MRATENGNVNVLLVEDEDPLRDLAGLILRKNPFVGPNGVTEKRDGVEALRAIEEDPEAFDLVISDVRMPTMNGSELARRILNMRTNVRVFLMSSGIDPSDGPILSSILPDDRLIGMITKPFGRIHLDQAVEVAAGRQLNGIPLETTRKEVGRRTIEACHHFKLDLPARYQQLVHELAEELRRDRDRMS